MKKFIFVLWLMIVSAEVMAQSFIIVDKNGKRMPYDVSKLDSVTFQMTPPGFTIYDKSQKSNIEDGQLSTTTIKEYSFEEVSIISGEPNFLFSHPDTVFIDSDVQLFTFQLNTNVEYTYKISADWLSFDSIVTDTDSLCFVSSNNPTFEDRVGYVVFSCQESLMSDTLWVVQSGKEASHETGKTIISKYDNTLSIKDNSGVIHHPFYVDEENVYIMLPNEDDYTNMEFIACDTVPYIINLDGTKIDGGIVDLSNFTKPLNCDWIIESGDTIIKGIQVCNIPVIMVETPDNLPITSKIERTEGCTIQLITQNNEYEDLGTAGIKGRGNSTWEQPKKPYNLKLDKKKEILGMKKSKHWLLLSNPYYDPTQLHNDVAFQIARMTDYPWVQSGKYVELILNGKHEGLYYFCEKVRIEKGKIEIAEINPDCLSGDSLTGGYLLEAGLKAKEDYYFTTDYYNKTGKGFEYSLVWNLDTPEGDVPQEQVDYIKNQFNHLESLIANEESLLSGAYLPLFDIETAINWFLVENLCYNQEASRSKNMLVYKDRDSSKSGGKLTMGPPWDLDAWTFNKVEYHYLYVRDYTWFFHRLLQDPFFISRLKEKWDTYYPAWKEQIPLYIDKQYEYINNSALRNRVLWTDWVTWYYGEKSYQEYVEDMKEAFLSQLEWMNTEIHNM